MNVLVQCPCARSPRLPEPAVLVFGQWDGTYVVARRLSCAGDMLNVFLSPSKEAAEREYRDRLEFERREAARYGWAEGEIIATPEGSGLAASILSLSQPDECMALVFGEGDFYVIAHRGCFFYHEIECRGRQGDDIGVNQPPADVGVYVFEQGRFIDSGWNPGAQHYDEEYLFGAWRAATLKDYIDFGVDLDRFTAPLEALDGENAAVLAEALGILKLIAGGRRGERLRGADLKRRIGAVLGGEC
jgi:hypothetical protein